MELWRTPTGKTLRGNRIIPIIGINVDFRRILTWSIEIYTDPFIRLKGSVYEIHDNHSISYFRTFGNSLFFSLYILLQ